MRNKNAQISYFSHQTLSTTCANLFSPGRRNFSLDLFDFFAQILYTDALLDNQLYTKKVLSNCLTRIYDEAIALHSITLCWTGLPWNSNYNSNNKLQLIGSFKSKLASTIAALVEHLSFFVATSRNTIVVFAHLRNGDRGARICRKAKLLFARLHDLRCTGKTKTR